MGFLTRNAHTQSITTSLSSNVPGIYPDIEDSTNSLFNPQQELLLTGLPASAHLIQFYESDTFLVQILKEFISHGLRTGDACIVIATPAHIEALNQQLHTSGLNLTEALSVGAYLALDAQVILSQLMDGDLPDPARFRDVIKGILTRVVPGQGQVRIFGEMVALLWSQGNHLAALQIEDLWNRVYHVHPFTLLCAYPTHDFSDGANADLLTQVCQQHASVIPSDNGLILSPEHSHTLAVEILERRVIEERLRVSENRYRRLFEATPDGILLIDPLTYQIMDANPSARSILGYLQEEIIGQYIWQVGLFPDQKIATATLQDIQQRSVLRLALEAGDGQNRDVEMVCTLYQANGHQILQCNLRDITERQQAETARRHWATIVASSNDAIIGKDLDGIVTNWNTAAERMYGYSAKEMVGQSIARIFPPDQGEELAQIMKRIRVGEQVGHYDTVRQRKDGKRLMVSVTISPVKDELGTIIGASAIARDITDQKLLEAKVQHLFTSNMIGVFVADFITSTFLEANDAFLELLGYTREELQSGMLRWDNMTPLEFHTFSQQAIEALLRDGASGTYEKEYLHKDGQRIPVLVAISRIDQTDTCIGFVLDNRARKELDRRKDTFISLASHELKTPITTMKTTIGLLQRRLGPQAEERTKQLVTRLDTQTNRLTRLINDLLDLSKIQIGQLIYREDRFALDTLAQETVAQMQDMTQTQQIQIIGQTGVEILADRDRIGQVLANLLTNAMKYAPQSEKVLVHLTKGANQVRVSVQDFGMGIAPEFQERIFDRFYQVSNDKQSSVAGLGLGLFLSREIIRHHGGQIGVESLPGQGAKFSFTLPLETETDK
jgi:PAS domain S-box-containing protein